MKIIVAGLGYVGKITADYLERKNEVIRIDPKFYPDKIEDYLDSDNCVICVDAPRTDENECDDSNVKSIINTLPSTMPILVRSTILPTIIKHYPNNVSYCPEFFREHHAETDFKNQKFMIIGSINHINYWDNIFNTFAVVETDRETAAMIKYIHNAWLAIKVTFFNEIYKANLCDFNDLTNILSLFPNIGPSHMSVPGPDGKYGFGGSCFPKDISALKSILKSDILESVININKSLRKTQND